MIITELSNLIQIMLELLLEEDFLTQLFGNLSYSLANFWFNFFIFLFSNIIIKDSFQER